MQSASSFVKKKKKKIQIWLSQSGTLLKEKMWAL